MPDLPEDRDASYADDAGDPSIKIHQQDHDALHDFYNAFELDDRGSWPNGGVGFYDTADDKFHVIDPEIAGSPGPTGETGRGLVFTGAWSNATTYHVYSDNDPEAYELATYLGHVYLALATHSNSTPQVDGTGQPVASANWGVFAAGGTDGIDGAEGQPGATGAQGIKGDPGPSEESGTQETLDGSLVVDIAQFSYAIVTLDGNSDISFTDTLGRDIWAVTVRIIMGAGGPYTITWNDVDIWQTSDGNPPDLSGMSEGDVLAIVVDSAFGFEIGYNPGGGAGAPPPPEIYPTLTVVDWLGESSTSNFSGVGTYSTTSNYQVGNKRGGHVLVVNSVDDGDTNGDPPVPVLTGGGASAWSQCATIVWPDTGLNRRRATTFAARDAVSGTAAPLVASLTGTHSNTGCLFKGHRTGGSVPASWLTLMVSTGVTRRYNQTSPTESGSTVHLYYAAASDAANRPAMFVIFNASQTITWEVDGVGGGTADWTEIGTFNAMINPTVRAFQAWVDDEFDTTATHAAGASVQWAAIGSEMEQGPLV